MFCLNSRQISIVELLINSYEPIKYNDVSIEYGVSTRTIRYDFELIESWLNENKTTLMKVPKKGVIIKTQNDRHILLEKLKFLSIENRVLSDKERVKYLILEFLISCKPLTIEELSKKLFLSRNTIMKILKDTKKFLNEFKIKLSKSTKGGFYIEGSEKRIRRLLLKIFLDIVDYENLAKLLREEQTLDEINEIVLNYSSYIHIEEMKKVAEYLAYVEKINNYYLTDFDLIKLVLYSEILIRRTENGNIIEKKSDSMFGTLEYEMSIELINKITSFSRVVVTMGEINEMAKYIIESKSYNSINDLKKINVTELADEKIVECATKVIDEVEKIINIKIKHDVQLFNGLVLHLKSAMARIYNDNQIQNKYLDEIKTNYPFVFQVVSEVIENMDYIFEKRVSEDEIAYIALHIRAAHERVKEESTKLKALIICPEGISFLSLISTKIKKEFPDLNLVETCSVYDYQTFKKDINFVISTTKMNIKDTDVIEISPFINNDDIYKINQLMIQLNKFRLIYKYNCEKEGVKMLMLKDILKKESIRLKVEANNWEEAVEAAGGILVSQKKVKQGYVDSMIGAIKDLGPYIVIMPGVAFAHARPDETVLETCMSMITLTKPVEFGSKHNDPVKLVFAFAANTGEAHLQALQDLAQFLSSEKNLKLLLDSEDCDEIYDKIIGEE
ncbi:BglG family transcription antiterminator [Clostridium sediminicola]|uniref:BglG family transcription antiterminator n=1 Tax=Clostridium sediminicola TaxID=3114879 RepID=UPI0031F1D1DC